LRSDTVQLNWPSSGLYRLPLISWYATEFIVRQYTLEGNRFLASSDTDLLNWGATQGEAMEVFVQRGYRYLSLDDKLAQHKEALPYRTCP